MMEIGWNFGGWDVKSNNREFAPIFSKTEIRRCVRDLLKTNSEALTNLNAQ